MAKKQFEVEPAKKRPVNPVPEKTFTVFKQNKVPVTVIKGNEYKPIVVASKNIKPVPMTGGNFKALPAKGKAFKAKFGDDNPLRKMKTYKKGGK